MSLNTVKILSYKCLTTEYYIRGTQRLKIAQQNLTTEPMDQISIIFEEPTQVSNPETGDQLMVYLPFKISFFSI